MFNYKKIIQLKITFVFIFLSNISLADNHNISEVLELIQKDLKTLEKAVYSESVNTGNLSGSLQTQLKTTIFTILQKDSEKYDWRIGFEKCKYV